MPQVLGRYHIISELGRGGMGVVYKAVDPKLERFIAIKCLSEELSSDEITVTRFLREARNVAALNHPHIAQIFLADEDEGKPYFVMEYIDGESLAERLAREKRLMPEQALRIVSECAEALKAAHEENIIHRDVKPGNIMLDRRGRTVLTDFGIASIVHPDQEPRSGQYIMGTPGYLPPEVIKGQPADHRGDLFALGAVLYEMLAGRRLVPGRGIEDTARTLLAKDFPELGDLDDQVDDFTFGVLGRMIAPDPDRRFQNYDDLLAGLRREQAAADASPESGSELDPTRLAGAAASRDADAPVVPNADAPETVDVDAEAAEPPATAVSPPPAGRNRAAKYSATAAVLLALCLVGFGMVRLIPERWDQVTALFQSADDTAVAPANETTPNPDPPDSRRDDAGQLSAVAGRHEDTRIAGSRRTALPATDSTETNRPVEPVAAGGDEQSAADPAVGARSTEDFLASALRLTASEGQGQATEAGAPATADDEASNPAANPPVATTDADANAQSASVDSSAAGVESRRRPAGTRTASVPPARPAVSSRPQPVLSDEPVLPEARGVLVVGQGDPVLVDPMVRTVESALRDDGHAIVDRGFVPDLASLTVNDEIDLAALARAAGAAGARYAVVVRAMPAGQRQLRYYSRTDTLFIVQSETATYDLAARRRLGATEIEQIEYTALNATEQAREAIAPRLAAIRTHLD